MRKKKSNIHTHKTTGLFLQSNVLAVLLVLKPEMTMEINKSRSDQVNIQSLLILPE